LFSPTPQLLIVVYGTIALALARAPVILYSVRCSPSTRAWISVLRFIVILSFITGLRTIDLLAEIADWMCYVITLVILSV